jgi:hypothetical protein
MLGWVLLFIPLAIYLLLDPFKRIPGSILARFIPCTISPWALTGKIASHIHKIIAPIKGPFVRIGIWKVGVLTRDLAVEILKDRRFQKIPSRSTAPMIQYGLPFVSDSQLAEKLRSSLFETVLARETFTRIAEENFWDRCLTPFLNKIEEDTPICNRETLSTDPDNAIQEYVRRVIFLIVLELPQMTEMPQIETGPAARNRMIAAVAGDNPILNLLVKGYNYLYGIPGIQSDDGGTVKFMDEIIENNPSIVQNMKEKGFTHQQIRCHLTTIFQAGTDTSSFALKVALIQLARRKDIQQLLYSKIADLPEKWNYSTLVAACPEILQFVYACLNFLTPIPVLRGRISESSTHLEDEEFPPGTIFAIPNDYIMSPHRVFTFRKDERERNLSFGAGHRVCPGKHLAEIELAMVISAVIRNYQLEDPQPNVRLEDECLSLITRYWTTSHRLIFSLR